MNNQPTPRRMKANPDKPFGHEVEHAWERDCDDIVPKYLPVDAPEPRILTKDFAVSTPTPPPASAPEQSPVCTCPIPSNNPDGYWHMPECPVVAKKPEGTPVERWLLEHERFTLEENENPQRLGDIIERLCALLSSQDENVRVCREVMNAHAAERMRLRQDAQEQRTRAEKAEWKLNEADIELVSERGGHHKALEVLGEVARERDQLKADLAAARERVERLESILTCTEKLLPPGCVRTRYALEEKLVKATDLLKLAVDRLEQAYVASEQHLGATPARSWEVAANGVRKFREGIASLDARAALAANKEGR